MAQGDLLIFINIVSWVFILFFSFYFLFYGRLLPSIFKNMRVQLFTEIVLKKQFFTFFLNFIDNLFWYNLIFKRIHFSFDFLKNVSVLYFRNVFLNLSFRTTFFFDALSTFKW